MRARKKKNADIRLQQCSQYLVENPTEHKGNWKELFKNDNEINIEIGAGKGKFITTLATLNKNINYIALEKEKDVLVTAAEAAKKAECGNLLFLMADANSIDEIFGEGEISLIYLNFSDPWTKKRYFKRRLTYSGFLNKYKKIMSDNAEIHQKTDNRELFEFSQNELKASGFSLKNITYDLHSNIKSDNVETEYEQRFKAQGVKIHRLEAAKIMIDEKQEKTV